VNDAMFLLQSRLFLKHSISVWTGKPVVTEAVTTGLPVTRPKALRAPENLLRPTMP